MSVSNPAFVIAYGPEGGPYTIVGSSNGLPVNVSNADLAVVGKSGDGAALSGNPLRVGGTDGTNLRTLATDASGYLKLNAFSLAAALADALANPTAGVAGMAQMLFNGATWDRARTPNVFKDVNAVSITSIATVWTPAAGKKFRLMGGVLSASAAINVLFEDNGAGNFIFRTPKLLVDTPFAFLLGTNGKLSAAADQLLKATGSAAGSITGTVFGTEES